MIPTAVGVGGDQKGVTGDIEQEEPTWQVALSTAVCRLRAERQMELADELARLLAPISQ